MVDVPLPVSFPESVSVASDCLVPANGLADELAWSAAVCEGVIVLSAEVVSVDAVNDDESCACTVLPGITAVELLVADVTGSVVLSAVLD